MLDKLYHYLWTSPNPKRGLKLQILYLTKVQRVISVTSAEYCQMRHNKACLITKYKSAAKEAQLVPAGKPNVCLYNFELN